MCTATHPLPPVAVPPIWLEAWVEGGQPSRSLSSAAEYSSSLGASPPTLRPGLGPFNKSQVIQMQRGGGGCSGTHTLRGVRWRHVLVLFCVRACVGSLPLSTCFIFSVCCFDKAGSRVGQRQLKDLEPSPLICYLLPSTDAKFLTFKDIREMFQRRKHFINDGSRSLKLCSCFDEMDVWNFSYSREIGYFLYWPCCAYIHIIPCWNLNDNSR